MIKVLIADDHAVVRQGLRQLLHAQADIEVVAEAEDGKQAVQLTQSLHPTVVLMDLLMPIMDGIIATKQILALNLGIGVLVLTSSLDDQLVKQALQAGAHGYLLKSSRVADVVEAIKRVASGQSALDPAVAQVLIHQSRTNDPLNDLTAREREVFDLLALGQSNEAIAETLSIGEVTVRTHIANLLDKLMLRDRTQVVIYALKRALIRVDDLP
ncbi:MAG: response regulator transcription factor [Anaerolineae bacterium]|jgi:NarL family two-component system response regulator LiaR|nr:response regulator transcription factor [Anaerolineae bacterium]